MIEKRKGVIEQKPTLTEKEKFAHVRDKAKLEAFLAAVIEHDGNITKAAKDVGYSRAHASKILNDSMAIRSLEFFMTLASHDVAAIKNRYLNNLKVMAIADLGSMVDNKGAFKGLHKLTPDQSFAIKKVKIKEKQDGSIETEIELHDKVSLNKMLAEADGTLNPVSDEEYEALMDGMTMDELLGLVVKDNHLLIIQYLSEIGYTVTFNENKKGQQ